VILSIYSNGFDATWHFDDLKNIELRDAIHMKEFKWAAIKRSFFIGKDEVSELPPDTLYRPVANFSFALNYYFGGLNVFGYHLVNVTIHILAAMFLYLFIYHTLNLPSLKPKYGQHAYTIAVLGTLLWAVNPVQTQAVTYIVQRMASMAGMFYIMAMYFYLKGRTSEPGFWRIWHFGLCLLSSVLAFGTKENAATLPFSMLLFDLFFVQGLTRESIKRGVIISFILMMIPPLVALMLRGPYVFTPKYYSVSLDVKRTFTLIEGLLTQPRIILFYISLLIYPIPQRLSIVHDIDMSKNLIDPPSTILSIVLILVVLILSIIKARKWPLISFCIIFFFLNHMIESGIGILEPIFEHRNYLPSMLLFIPVAILFVRAIQYYDNRAVMQGVISAFLILVVAGFANGTYLRNHFWRTKEALWQDAANKAPDSIRPHMSLATYYNSIAMEDKAYEEWSLAEKSRSVSNKVDLAVTQYCLGLYWQKKGELGKAFDYYQKSTKSYPPYASSHNNLGILYQDMGMMKDAMKEFELAIRWDPAYFKGYRNAARLLLKDQQFEKAMRYFDRALEINNSDQSSLTAKAYIYRVNGAFDKAFDCLKRVIAIEPHDPKAHLYLAEIFLNREKNNLAEVHLQEFIKREKDMDLSGYVEGIIQEEKINVIAPYKKQVLQRLSLAYENLYPKEREGRVKYLKEIFLDTRQ
jgi:tetratricopeptide (TPR) repeat protein